MDSGSGNASGSSAESAKTSSTSGDANTRKGCVCASATNINIRVTPTTGGHFDLSIAKSETIENLKKVISKKLKVPKERICLLHRDRQLRDGTITENQLMDGSRLTLLPSVETGLLAQRPEQSVMQALESLNDAQVNDFLSGKAPLNLTMRLGDHMMLIQLQLSTVTPSSSSRRTAASTAAAATSTSSSSSDAAPPQHTSSSLAQQRSYLASSLSDVISGMARNLTSSTSASKASPSSLKISTTRRAPAASTKVTPRVDPTMEFASSFRPGDSPSPSSASRKVEEVKALAKEAFRKVGEVVAAAEEASSSREISKPATSILKSLEMATRRLEDGNATSTATTAGDKATCDKATPSDKAAATVEKATASGEKATTAVEKTPACKCEPAVKPVLDTRALAEASRNLTQTLKQLSSEVLTSRADPAEDTARARRQGAIIESMHHHGKGVYSGTFSGTLNPALQDRFGRPKRDISTIIHILNDLLCATPQYRRHARHAAAAVAVDAAAAAAARGVPDVDEAMEFGEDSLLRENQATRGKLEQLRMIMEERRARRRARRDARSAPYTTQWSAKSESLAAQSVVEPMEATAGDATELCEMATPAGSVVA